MLIQLYEYILSGVADGLFRSARHHPLYMYVCGDGCDANGNSWWIMIDVDVEYISFCLL